MGKMEFIKPSNSGLLQPSPSYKPFRYPWAFEFWQKQQQVHWMPEEVPLGEDIKDWSTNLTAVEKNLLTQIFRFFTQSDVEVGANYMENYMPLFKPVEVRMMLASFSNMETIHIAAYALLLETIGMPDAEFSAFMEYDEMAAKHDYLGKFGVETEKDILTSMAVFGGFTEGLQLFASFAMLMNFPRMNKMKGMGQIVTWSIRDESLHDQAVPHLCPRNRRADEIRCRRHHRLLSDSCEAGRQVHRSGIRNGPCRRHDVRGYQTVHPLHR